MDNSGRSDGDSGTIGRMPAVEIPEAPFRALDARSLGLPLKTLRTLRTEGLVVQPVRGVLMRSDRAADPVARSAAVALALPDGAAVTRSLAAWMHGVDPRAPWQRDEPLPVECVVPRGTEPPDLPNVISHVDLLDARDVMHVNGVPVTTPDRTALDLARFLRPHMGLAVLDSMAHAGQIDVDALAERVGIWRRQRGIAQARRLIGLCEPDTESFGESWLRLRIVDAGFPRPEPQIWVFDENGIALYRLDMGWRERRIAVEYDGLEFHDAPEQRKHDIARRDELARRFGWDVLGVGRGEVLGRSLELERGIGDMLGLAPQITTRTW